MTFKKLGILFILLLIIATGLGSILYTTYRLRDHEEFLSDYTPQIKQIERAKGKTITLTETKDGHRRWVLKMKEIRYSKDNSAAQLIDVKGLVYGDKQEILFAFNAPAGKFFKESNRVILSNGAQIISPSAKVVIKANQMDWSSRKGSILAKGGVRMKKANFGISQAEAAVFAMDFSKIEFKGKVVSVIGSHPNTGDQN